MNHAFRVTLFVGGVFTVLVATSTTVFAAKSVNDSLVQGLSCQNLNVDNIYRAIRADAFSEKRNMPIVNWEFQSGAFPLGNCWALSSTQRMFSYLARYNESNTMTQEQRRNLVLDMVRRGTPVAKKENDAMADRGRGNAYGQNKERLVTSPLKTYSVFPVERDSVNESYDFWWGLRDGYKAKVSKFNVTRSFREDVQVNQNAHFFRGGNLGMGLGSGPTSAKENYETVKVLMRNLSGKRLTLVNIRMERTNQHVVMLKSFVKNSNGLIEFTAYDSNQPEKDQILTYDSKTGEFTSQGIAGLFYGRFIGEKKPLAVFIVDEEERGAFEQAMLKYYQSRCK